MEALSFAALAAACAPLVDIGTAQAIVQVESGFHRNAIGVVGGQLERQPRTVLEAVATAQVLKRAGWNFSLGLAQINLRNFPRLGLAIGTALDPCSNLRAMQTLLVDCFDRATRHDGSRQDALRKALSCYYSGNFVTGLREGYVSRVVSASRSLAVRPPTTLRHKESP